MKESDAKILQKLSNDIREEAAHLGNMDPGQFSEEELGRRSDALMGLAERLDTLYGEKNRLRIRRVFFGFLLYLLTFGVLIFAFMQCNLFADADYAKIARQLFPSAESHDVMVHYLKLGGSALLSLFIFLTSFLVVMILSAFVGIFRVSWLHALTEAIGTAVFSTALFIVYYVMVFKAGLMEGLL